MLSRCALAVLAAAVLLLLAAPVRPAFAPVARAAEMSARIPAVLVHPPRDLPTTGKPLQVLVVLHGIGGTGEQIASQLVAQADRNHWLLVAPTIDYGDWTDPNQVAREEPQLIRWLSEYLDQLPDIVGAPIRPRVLLLGHSRGAQLAHRFALFQPERILAVAALAAGTYTLPLDRTPQGSLITFPFGISDLPKISGHPFSRTRFIEDTHFWLGVGTEDNNPNDLPRAWDQYLGTTRVQRARAFQAALHELGARSVLVAFRGER
ncbi:MAG TPA: alpha/beta hydrolase-fold protein, partial [Chloroflexota bacterium]|nr:alpha/beta hydrolase-fold protein [Chloroflexota bacterium]